MNQNNSKFQKLEMLNAQIDVWIDEEEYKQVKDALTFGDKQLEDWLKVCFEHNDHCTKVKEVSKVWEQALNEKLWSRDSKDTILPIKKVYGVGLDAKEKIDWYWSRLFYAKLLRARIQERGTDCYFRRLDDVVAYLERYLPQAGGDAAKLVVIYLLELSAAAEGIEQRGFAERARRVIREHSREVFKDFYNLWARYNIGVAYFHEARYRKAVLEFNEIIYQAKQLKNAKNDNGNKRKLEFFETRQWNKLLLLPAIICRANVQLKLQLAYHALDTVTNDDYKEYFNGNEYEGIRSQLIQAEAYQQMEQLDKSWECLGKVYERLEPGNSLGDRKECTVPSDNKDRPNIRGRFFELLVEDHLCWLKPKAKLAANDNRQYLSKLEKVLTSSYFDINRHNTFSRRGYWQQLAEYLALLVNSDNTVEIAERVYEHCREGLLEEEDENGNDVGCYYCKPQGIALRRLGSDHYDTFKKNVFEFYNKVIASKGRRPDKTLTKDKERFIKRLIGLERKSREDLRIRDLNLRYGSTDVLDKIRLENSSWRLCWEGSTDKSAFAGLLKCAGNGEKAERSNYLSSKHYQNINDQWKRSFTQHLKKRSIHESHAKGFYFMGLRRWNSSSPAKGRSVGGGYLLYHIGDSGLVDLGIAIDPGFDFVRNLFHMGFSLYDIDIVLISHAHPDHIRDFESMILLLYELQKRDVQDRRIHVILTLGTYRRLEHIVEDPILRYFIEPYIIDISKEIARDYFESLPRTIEFRFEHIKKSLVMDYQAIIGSNTQLNTDQYPRVTIKPTRAYHDDSSGYSDSFGFLIELELPGNGVDNIFTFGYTGDTKWVYPKIDDPIKNERIKERIIKDIACQYTDSGCGAILVHVGSLIDDRRSFDYYNQCRCVARWKKCDKIIRWLSPQNRDDRCEELIREMKHPYLIGILRLLSSFCHQLNQGGKSRACEPLILLSEFGEELGGGIRKDLTYRLRKAYENRLALLPVDVGMNVQLWHDLDENNKEVEKKHVNKVWCVQCKRFVPVETADFERYGEDEALFCVCETCCRATPMNVLQDRLRHLYDVGYELRTD